MRDLDNQQLEKLDKGSLIAMIVEMREVLAKQAALIQDLRDQLAKNSQNSGKPPSSDGLAKQPRSLREKGKRRSGGQTGHEGHTLKMVERPDHVERHEVTSCPHCAADLRATAADEIERRQVFDVPPVRVEVTEHQVEVKHCPQCGRRVKGSFPAGVIQPVQYGPVLKAQAVYLTGYQLLPLARCCELFGDLYGHTPAEAFVLEAQAACRGYIQPALDRIQSELVASPLVHFDESGVRVEGRLNWLHSAGTQHLTYYAIHPKRGKDGMQAAGILPNFRGRAMHDHWSPYLTFEHCQHAFCNAHHLRELRFIFEQYHQDWAQAMSQLLLTMKAEVEAALPDHTSLSPERIAHHERHYDRLLRQGFKANPPPVPLPIAKRGRKQQSPARNLLHRLQQHKAETLAFIYDFRVPFDNNLAERDVRMVKVKQKVSGSFRTPAGADTFCSLRSYISTVRKHGINVIQAIHTAFLDQPFLPMTCASLPE
jgi:transposase